MSVSPEEHDYIGQVIAEDAAARKPRKIKPRKRPCDQCLTCKGTGIEHDGAAHPCTDCDGKTVPPAGGDVGEIGDIDVAAAGVLRFWAEDAHNIRCVRAEDFDTHVTRLTAERDALKAEVERKQKTIEGMNQMHVESVEYFQSELTKARESNAEMASMLLDWQTWLGAKRESCDEGGKILWDRINAVTAHQSAPAAKGGSDE